MEQSKEVKLAYEIATILNDLDSIDWHIANAKMFSEALMRKELNYVLSRNDISNRAGYYNTLMKRHARKLYRD